MKTLFYNGFIHSLTNKEDVYSYLEMDGDEITYIGNDKPKGKQKLVNLEGKHVYPSMTDSHLHLLYSIVLASSSLTLCEITKNGVEPHNIDGIKKKIEEYCKNTKSKLVVINQYIASAIDENRLPTRFELDEWSNNKEVIVYNIDGHSSAMSTSLIKALGENPEESDGVFRGEAHDFRQGKVTSYIASKVSLSSFIRGINTFTNECMKYGITRVCALDGDETSKKDSLLKLLTFFARRMNLDVYLFPQYTSVTKAEPLFKYMRGKRIGGCDKWELDGSVGSHSAAFYTPYIDNNQLGHLYYVNEVLERKVGETLRNGAQFTCHAIGEAAIDQIVKVYFNNRRYIPSTGPYARIDHFEFPSEQAIAFVKERRIALTLQPGFSFIDKRYLHSYERFLPKEIIDRQVPIKELMDSNVCICGSSDSPVQDVNPFAQMLGMTDFYVENQSISPYEAILTYTQNPAKMLGEGERFGTLEIGKEASFFITKENLVSDSVDLSKVVVEETYFKGKKYIKKKSVFKTLLQMLLKKPQLI